MEIVGRHLGREGARVGRHGVQQLGVCDLAREVDLQPVGGIMALGVGVELGVPNTEHVAWLVEQHLIMSNMASWAGSSPISAAWSG